MTNAACRMLAAAVLTVAGSFWTAAGAPAWAWPGDTVKVVASFTILADITAQVGGRDVDVVSIVGPDQDVHAYVPSARDVRALSKADVFVVNGLGLESWTDALIRDAGYTGPVVVASAGVPVLTGPVAGQGQGGDTVDPHAWQDLTNGRTYAANIAKALMAVDSRQADAYARRAGWYDRILAGLDLSIRNRFHVIEVEKNKVIATHAAFRYFSHAYGIAFHRPETLRAGRAPLPDEVAALIAHMKENRIRGVFVENTLPPAAVKALKEEADAIVGGTLYADSLSTPGGPASTYVEMFRHNVRELTKTVIW